MIFTHPICALHEMGPGHPESPERLAAVLTALQAPRFTGIQQPLASKATRKQLLTVHDSVMVDRLFTNAPSSGYQRLDPDTLMNIHSLEAALHAAGAVVAAVDLILEGKIKRAFCAVRPPGHHATRTETMGFCLFNNIAVGAAHALASGLHRVAILDFDVHHGNGTQDIFAKESRVVFASSHQSPLYPGTGADTEYGIGNIHNAVLAPGAGSSAFRDVWSAELLPHIDAFVPELIFISAGFDAHRLDPLAQLNLHAEDFAWITEQIVALAEQHSQGRVISSLEGGYSLTALRECTTAHCAALFGV